MSPNPNSNNRLSTLTSNRRRKPMIMTTSPLINSNNTKTLMKCLPMDSFLEQFYWLWCCLKPVPPKEGTREETQLLWHLRPNHTHSECQRSIELWTTSSSRTEFNGTRMKSKDLNRKAKNLRGQEKSSSLCTTKSEPMRPSIESAFLININIKRTFQSAGHSQGTMTQALPPNIQPFDL